MKSALLVVVASCVSALWAGEPNLLRNASFRADASGKIPDWRVEALESAVAPGAGPYGADVLRLPLKDGRAYVVQGGIPLKAGTPAVFGAWVRTRGLAEKAAHILLVSDEWRISHCVDLPADTQGEWQRVEKRVVLKPDGPYAYALQVERRVRDGAVEIALPHLRADGPRAQEDPSARGDGRLVFHFDFNSLQRGKEAVLETLRQVAADGYDAVLWEIENAVRFECCPEVAAPDAFAKDEFRAILAEAKRLGLEPIPLMQTFGHGEYVLRHDRFRPLREVAERYDCYCPSKPETRAFQKRLLHEYLELFGPDVKRFHLGGDEAWLYQTCAACQRRNALELYVEHLTEVSAELRARGIRPGCWHDMAVKFSCESGSRPERFRDYTIWFWDYAYPKSWHPWGQADAPLRELRAVGCETVICGSAQSWKEDPFLVRYGAHRENLAACAALARRERLSGLCVTSWTIHQGLKRLQRPLYAFAAKRYRNPGAAAADDWRDAVTRAFGPVPTDALDRLSAWEVRYGQADGRGWAGYKDGSVPPPDILAWRFEAGQAGRDALAKEFDGVIASTEAALARIRAVPGLTSLGELLVEAGELRLAFHRVAAAGLRGAPVGELPLERTRRHYELEYAPESAARATRIVYAPYADGER